MLRAMVEAPVGDDVLGDDPTVSELETNAAMLLGKEASLFVVSGTMANNIAINVQTRPGDEMLCDAESHSMCYEVGAPAAISGVLTRQFRSDRGIPRIDEIEDSIRQSDLHAPGTRLIALENTHNRHGGAIIPVVLMRDIYMLARERGVAVHLDGARIFNAAVATGIPARESAAQADSVSFCLSKGLGCPVGSVLCGTREFIERARRVRKKFGGGMRQVGLLAACGIVALDSMIDRLADDHCNARRLADGITGLPGICVDSDSVQTNMVYFETSMPAPELVSRLDAAGVKCLDTDPHRIRLVTHKDVTGEDIDRAVAVFRRVVAGSD